MLAGHFILFSPCGMEENRPFPSPLFPPGRLFFFPPSSGSPVPVCVLANNHPSRMLNLPYREVKKSFSPLQHPKKHDPEVPSLPPLPC